MFDYAFCPNPSCAVIRACILTGQHSHTHGQYGHCRGIHGFRTHEHMQSTPRILKAHQYATACIGKKHVQPPSVFPFDHEPEVDPRSPVDIATNVAAFLTEHRDDPFYLHVGSTHPHRAAVGFGNHLQPAGVEPVPCDPAKVVVPNFLPDVPQVREDLAEYYQSVSRFDQVVGAVLRELEASGRAGETLLFVTTDQPYPSGRQSGQLRQRPPLPADRGQPRAKQPQYP